MRLERKKNAKFNIIWGTANNIVEIVSPFICRTVLLHVLGSEILGLDSLFISVLSIINIAEMGFASAVAFSMYKPIAQSNYESIRKILNYLKRVYRYIGIIILSIGIILLPFLPNLIKNGLSSQNGNLYLLFSIYLCDSVLGYLILGHWSTLLSAFQANGYINIVKLFLNIIRTGVQVFSVLYFKEYFYYVLVIPITTVLSNVLFYKVCKKKYPSICCSGEVDNQTKKDIILRVKGLVIYKICSLSRNTFDSVFISAFLGLTINAYYIGYFSVYAALSKLMSVISESLISGVGNSMNLDSIEKNYHDMNRLNFVYMLIGGWMSICMLCLYQPFIALWLGKEAVFGFGVPLSFALYFYIAKMGDIRAMYSDAAGLWWENRYRSIFEAITNIILNYILINVFGVLGVVLASLLSILMIGFPLSTKVLFDRYFTNHSIMDFFISHIKYFFVSLIIGAISYGLCVIVHGSYINTIMYRCVICIFITPLLYWIVYYRIEYFEEVRQWILKILK